MRYIVVLFLFPFMLTAQLDLPLEVRLTPEGTLKHGGEKVEGFYDIDQVHKLEITLVEPDWFRLMDGSGGGPGGPGGGGNRDDGELLVGTLTLNDEIVLDSVLVGIKGQTSDFRNNSEKKSFKVEIDAYKDQRLMGYDNLNLNCAFDDHSFMREVLYYDISRGFTQALKGSFVDLYINGEYWGPYNNIQQIEGTYISEWFRDNDGTRWRAVATEDAPPTGGGGGPGGGIDPSRFGAGVSSLNYNGPDSTDYNFYYTLKKTEKEDPWTDLIKVCDLLNNTPIEDLYEVMNPVLDIDRTLWMLAQEIVASDDDGYFFKGGMDYYVYWDKSTERLMPLEVDGNSVMAFNHLDWGPFYREDDDRFPLLNKLLQNEEIRQRYLAHLRTVLSEYFVEEKVHQRIDDFAAILDARVNADPKKIYSYTQFIAGVEELKNFVTQRTALLLNNTEIDREGLVISEVTRTSSSGEDTPQVNEEVIISAEVNSTAHKLQLYYARGLDGAFDRIEMLDDGLNDDLILGDNVYTAKIPGYAANTFVRYYLEAINDDSFGTASFHPAGAEREAYLYQVQPTRSIGDVVINEFMASNSMTAADGTGAFPDWIELYNTGINEVDLTGYYLTDDITELDKWQFLDNTTIASEGYLIIWADSDEEQTTADELHSNFKLSAGGESVLLVNSAMEIEDQIDYDEQRTDIGYARIPNGIGDFEFRTPTFNGNNDSSISNIAEEELVGYKIYPNPTEGLLTIEFQNTTNSQLDISICNALGQFVYHKSTQSIQSKTNIAMTDIPEGLYTILIRNNYRTLRADKLMIVK